MVYGVAAGEAGADVMGTSMTGVIGSHCQCGTQEKGCRRCYTTANGHVTFDCIQVTVTNVVMGILVMSSANVLDQI